MLSFALLVLIFIGANPSWATDYYVDQSHPSANDQNPGTIAQPWRTITKANQTLTAGDTLYIKGGIYNSYIAPNNSGTSSNRITYRNYGTDVVTISGTTYVVYLNGKSYITVTGINGTNFYSGIVMTGNSTYNIISYGIFGPSNSVNWDVSYIRGTSQYNWIHHCTFYQGGGNAGGDDRGMVFDIGIDDDGTHLYNPYYAHYNLIEDNIFYWGGHHVFGLYSRYNTVRNNYFHNEVWSNGYGNRVLFSNGYTNPVGGGVGDNLVEGNKFGYSAESIDNGVVSNIAMCTPYNIIRYNKIYHSNGEGITFYAYSPTMPEVAKGANNKVYNNTFFNNGYGVSGGNHDSAIYFQQPGYAINNVFKNNLYYSHYQVYAGTTSDQIFANEFNGDVSGNPKFMVANTTPPADKTNSSIPDLNLQSDSPAINAGGALTTVAVADTGSGTSLVVSDARYFQYGQYAPSGTVYADWIAVGTVNNTVQISSINYSTNTITLANSISRNDNDSVWLYKKSDGVQVLYGSAPDAGAYEFTQTEAPSPPRNLRIESSN